MLDDELATSAWLSGEAFGLGDIAVAPFVYNLMTIVESWQPRRTCSVGTSSLTNARRGAMW